MDKTLKKVVYGFFVLGSIVLGLILAFRSIPKTPLVRYECAEGERMCVHEFPDLGSVHLRVETTHPEVNRPQEVNVRVWPDTESAPGLELTGRDMFMGLSRYALEKRNAGEYSGQFVVPVCTVDNTMHWNLTVAVIKNKTRYELIMPLAPVHK